MNKLLVLGIGNMLLTDDGVGVFASQELMKEDWPEQVTIREGGRSRRTSSTASRATPICWCSTWCTAEASRGPSTGSPRTR